jgi:hypothetical protein
MKYTSLLAILSLSVFTSTSIFCQPTLADPSSSHSITSAIDTIVQSDIKNAKELEDKLTEIGNDIPKGFSKAMTATIAAERNKEHTIDGYIDDAMSNAVGTGAGANFFSNTIMATRMRQLNAAPLGSNENRLLVDPSVDSSPPASQQFSIFMRLFCDPYSLGGRIANKEFNVNGMVLKCGGHVGDAPENFSRQDFFSGDDAEALSSTAQQLSAAKLLNLPLNASELFFSSSTYPVSKGPITPSTPTGYEYSNLNPAGQAYYAAILSAIEFLTGTPQAKPFEGDLSTANGQGMYNVYQTNNARMLVASKIFADLAGDRLGVTGPEMAETLADLWEKYLGDSADNNTMAEITALRNQPSVSVAQYSDIMMNKVISTPGYIESINKMNEGMLDREKIRLTAMAITLGYKRNKLMEQLSALEATKDGGRI